MHLREWSSENACTQHTKVQNNGYCMCKCTVTNTLACQEVITFLVLFAVALLHLCSEAIFYDKTITILYKIKVTTSL